MDAAQYLNAHYDTKARHLAALILRLKTCKAGETYPLDPYERYLILKEIARDR